MPNAIYDKDTIGEAANIVHKYPLILIIGDQINPVPLDDYVSLRTKIYSEKGKRPMPRTIDAILFRKYERFRLITSNCLPHWNLLCILRLIRMNVVRAIISTNFDCYLRSTLSRYGGKYIGVLNPCVDVENEAAKEWCCDGYYSIKTRARNEIPIWKIHGDLGYVRMIDCDHIFALPKFQVERPPRRLFESSEPACCHFAILKANGSPFNHDPSLAREHPSSWYKHNIDYGTSRDLVFERLRRAAAEQLIQHCNEGGAIFIIGMTFNPSFGEDLTNILLGLPAHTPIIYLVASKGHGITTSDSELLEGLRKGQRDHVLINEISETGAIDEALVKLLNETGETGIDSEYSLWKEDDRWWKKLKD